MYHTYELWQKLVEKSDKLMLTLKRTFFFLKSMKIHIHISVHFTAKQHCYTTKRRSSAVCLTSDFLSVTSNRRRNGKWPIGTSPVTTCVGNNPLKMIWLKDPKGLEKKGVLSLSLSLSQLIYMALVNGQRCDTCPACQKIYGACIYIYIFVFLVFITKVARDVTLI